MSFEYYLPTKLVMGDNCVIENKDIFASFGTKAMIVTGRSSAKLNGSLDDVVKVLSENNQHYCIYDKVKSNPDIACVYDGAEFAKGAGVDFIIAIGGGSPMDAAKAMAVLSVQDISEEELFKEFKSDKMLPTIFIPTTAGTGSEVTQYSILTNYKARTKTTLAAPFMFPDVSFLDPKYMEKLPIKTTVNTAIDALTHLIESYLSIKANAITKAMSLEGMSKIASKFAALKSGELTLADRRELLLASTYGGMVIAQTGTTAVHSMGYSLTYFEDIDHGRANGLTMCEFLKFIEKSIPDMVTEILTAMGYEKLKDFTADMDELLGDKEKITEDELKEFSAIAIKAKNISNCMVVPSEKDLFEIYSNVFLSSSEVE